MKLEIGSIVSRNSYKRDLLFRVIGFSEDRTIAELAGEELRLWADAPVDDLFVVDDKHMSEHRQVEKEKEESSLKLFRQDYYLLRQKESIYRQTAINTISLILSCQEECFISTETRYI